MKKIFILVLTFCLIFCGESFAVKKEKQIDADCTIPQEAIDIMNKAAKGVK